MCCAARSAAQCARPDSRCAADLAFAFSLAPASSPPSLLSPSLLVASPRLALPRRPALRSYQQADNRNRLALLQIDIQTVTMGLGICSMVSGFFGMNLSNSVCGPDGCLDYINDPNSESLVDRARMHDLRAPAR